MKFYKKFSLILLTLMFNGYAEDKENYYLLIDKLKHNFHASSKIPVEELSFTVDEQEYMHFLFSGQVYSQEALSTEMILNPVTCEDTLKSFLYYCVNNLNDDIIKLYDEESQEKITNLSDEVRQNLFAAYSRITSITPVCRVDKEDNTILFTNVTLNSEKVGIVWNFINISGKCYLKAGAVEGEFISNVDWAISNESFEIHKDFIALEKLNSFIAIGEDSTFKASYYGQSQQNNHSWILDGVEVSTDEQFSKTFTTPGVFTLQAQNSDNMRTIPSKLYITEITTVSYLKDSKEEEVQDGQISIQLGDKIILKAYSNFEVLWPEGNPKWDVESEVFEGVKEYEFNAMSLGEYSVKITCGSSEKNINLNHTILFQKSYFMRIADFLQSTP